MNVIHAAADLKPGPGGVCLAIGVFDGVHLGHQRVIGRACQEAQRLGAPSVVVTFDRHPNAVVAPKNVPPLIYPLSRKLRVIDSLGVDAACVIHFDKAFSEVPGEQFIRSLARDFNSLRAICVGETFQFGCRRSGDVALLKSLGAALGYALHALPSAAPAFARRFGRANSMWRAGCWAALTRCADRSSRANGSGTSSVFPPRTSMSRAFSFRRPAFTQPKRAWAAKPAGLPSILAIGRLCRRQNRD
jgi:cytidyltransferase-like protein